MKSEVKDGYTLKLGSAQVSFDALLNHRYAIDVGVDLIVLGIRDSNGTPAIRSPNAKFLLQRRIRWTIT